MRKCLSYRDIASQKNRNVYFYKRLDGLYNLSDLPFMVIHINLNLYYL